MEIKPVKKINRVKQSGVSTGDVMRKPHVKVAPPAPPQESIGFQGRRLVFAGQDMGKYIQQLSIENPALLAKLAHDLETFKKDAGKRRRRKAGFFGRSTEPEYTNDELDQIHALCEAYVAKISDLIKQRYDETRDGFHIIFDEMGQLILNGMNVHALIGQCEEQPNPKSLLFLKGLKSRLERVREVKIGSRNFDRIEEIVSALIQRCQELLEQNMS